MITIIGYILLGTYHAFIVVPMFFIIPEALIIAGYLLYEKKLNHKYLQHFFTVAGLTFLIATIATHIFFKNRHYVNYVNIPILGPTLELILMIIFCIVPFVPIPLTYYINKHVYKKKERKLFYFSTAYFFYAILIIIFFIKNAYSVHLPAELMYKPLLLPNLVNFTEIFDLFQSQLFHDMLHFIF